MATSSPFPTVAIQWHLQLMRNMPDTIRNAIIARADQLGLTAYAISKAANLDPQTVKRYLAGRASLNSRYVSAICEVLGLELREIDGQEVRVIEI